MITLMVIALMVTSPVVLIGIPSLQARLEAWDYRRHLND